MPHWWCHGQIDQGEIPQAVFLKARIRLNYCKYTWNPKLARRAHWRYYQPVPDKSRSHLVGPVIVNNIYTTCTSLWKPGKNLHTSLKHNVLHLRDGQKRPESV